MSSRKELRLTPETEDILQPTTVSELRRRRENGLAIAFPLDGAEDQGILVIAEGLAYEVRLPPQVRGLFGDEGLLEYVNMEYEDSDPETDGDFEEEDED